MSERSSAYSIMRESFREKAEKNSALYGQLCSATPKDSIEKAIDVLWLQSVTDGSESYKTYLVSPLWKLISQDILLRDQHKCSACHRDAELVHHRNYSYEVMAGLDDDQLISLCKPCHNFVHFDNFKKIPKRKWDKRLRYLHNFYTRKRIKRECLLLISQLRVAVRRFI